MSRDDPKTPMQIKVEDLARIVRLREKEIRKYMERITTLERAFQHSYRKGEGIGEFPCERCGLPRKDLIHYTGRTK